MRQHILWFGLGSRSLPFSLFAEYNKYMTRRKLAKNKVHFIGIGGIGMSALARWYLAKKWTVTGSDLVPSQITEELEKDGVSIQIGHKKENLEEGTSLVIYTMAVCDDNQEFLEAKKRGLELESYAQALGGLTKAYTTLAVAGSHGKSTTTAFLALALIEGGIDPTVVIGTKLKEFGGSNFYFGKSNYMVIEADEWHESFLNYSPLVSIITNIDKEHLDFYKTFSNLKKIFLKFIEGMKKNGNGLLVVNEDDDVLVGMKDSIEKTALANGSKVIWYSTADQVAQKIRRILKIAGEHNVSNALGAYMVAREFKVAHSDILKAFKKFSGSWRRMEYRGKFKIQSASRRAKTKIQVYDDYAHHPTEIRATLKAFKEKFSCPLVCVFQPHQAQRLRLLFKEFVDSFELADLVVILPIYKVAGRDSSSNRYSSKALVNTIQKKYADRKIVYFDDLKNLPKFLNELLGREGLVTPPLPVILMMGAGDISTYSDNLV